MTVSNLVYFTVFGTLHSAQKITLNILEQSTDLMKLSSKNLKFQVWNI